MQNNKRFYREQQIDTRHHGSDDSAKYGDYVITYNDRAHTIL